MQTPQDILDGLTAVRQDTDINIQLADPDTVLEAMYELGFEHESAWFYEWNEGFDPASDPNAKPKLNVARYTQAVVDLDSPAVLKLGNKKVTYNIESGETEHE